MRDLKALSEYKIPFRNALDIESFIDENKTGKFHIQSRGVTFEVIMNQKFDWEHFRAVVIVDKGGLFLDSRIPNSDEEDLTDLSNKDLKLLIESSSIDDWDGYRVSVLKKGKRLKR